jgi:hypothetical protein
MLVVLTAAIMLIVAYSYFREGVLTALTMLVNIVLAGLVAFNFFEPIADQLESSFDGTILAGLEDCITLFALFALTLGGLRVITNNLANQQVELPALVQQLLGGFIGLMAGYLLAGFLLCMVQTLPLSEKFMGFDSQADPNGSGMRRFLPPDRVWLAMMSKAGIGPLSQAESVTFDPEGTFELRYALKRRVKE